MRKLFLLLTICLLFTSCKKETKVPQVPTPKYVGTWYGAQTYYSNAGPGLSLKMPIIRNSEDYNRFYGPITFESKGVLKNEGTIKWDMHLYGQKMFKYKDNGEYLTLTDEFDKPANIMLKIVEANDIMCNIRVVSGDLDINIVYYKYEDVRLKRVKQFYGEDVDEDKLRKELGK